MILISPRHERLYKTYEALFCDDFIQKSIVDIICNFCNKTRTPNDYLEYTILQKLCTYNFIKYEPTFFPDGEINVQIPFAGHNLKIIHPIVDDTSVLELCFMLDSISRSGNRPLNVSLSIPYMRYARQDRVCSLGESVSAISIIRIILSHAEDLKMMQFFDVHNDGILNAITKKNIFVQNLKSELLFSYIYGASGYGILDSNTVVVAPDIGAAKRARGFAQYIKSKFDITIVDKVRKGPGQSQSLNITGQDVNGKVCVITDDIVDSASTLCNAANILKDKGAEKVYACITHGVFSGDAVKKIEDSAIEKLFVTDSNVFDINGSTKIEVVPLVLFEMINPLTTLVNDLTGKWDLPLANKILFEIFNFCILEPYDENN